MTDDPHDPEALLLDAALATIPTGVAVSPLAITGAVARILGVAHGRVRLVAGSERPRILLDGEPLSHAIGRAEAVGWGLAGATETWVDA